jgi:hypothetical protein
MISVIGYQLQLAGAFPLHVTIPVDHQAHHAPLSA